MKISSPSKIYLTFDCDPSTFDASLEPLGDRGYMHLRKSIPEAVRALRELSECLGQEVKGTFFVRNTSTNSSGEVHTEPWSDFMDLWEELITEGHGLGLHPHIDKPLSGLDDPNFAALKIIMEKDFDTFTQMNEAARITRIGGHSYNYFTSALLRECKVDIDSSAIPGRKLGKFELYSNWLETDNHIKQDWTYPSQVHLNDNLSRGLIQLPMTTLTKRSQPEYRRYIDFSFKGFEEFSVSESLVNNYLENIVAITHPSTLLTQHYLDHETLELGMEHWLKNALKFIKVLTDGNREVIFKLMRDCP